MNIEKIAKVEKEMKRLSANIKDLKEALTTYVDGNNMFFFGNKYTGAVRRSSMDLTRALSELRKA